MDFRVGERVRIKRDITSGGVIKNTMLQYAGTVVTIDSFNTENIFETGHNLYWPITSIEKLSVPNRKIKIGQDRMVRLMVEHSKALSLDNPSMYVITDNEALDMIRGDEDKYLRVFKEFFEI